MLLDILQVISWLVVGALIFLVAATVGFDFGVGILAKFVGKGDYEKRAIINIVGPTWDGSQVWFITAGGAIFAIWPQVYATSFSGLYIAILVVLWGLFLRPPAFEYRKKVDNPKWRNFWDWMLVLGGIIPIVVMGIAVGNLYLGFPIAYDDTARLTYGAIVNGQYQSMWITLIHLLSPFALLFGVFALIMALMHGAAYAKLRTAGILRDRFRKVTNVSAMTYILLFIVAGIWINFIPGYQYTPSTNLVNMSDALHHPFTSGAVTNNYSWYYNFNHAHIWMWFAPILAIIGAIFVIKFNKKDKDGFAFLASTASILGAVLTVGFTLFPFIMVSNAGEYQYSLTIWNASSSQTSLIGILCAAIIILPIIFSYTFFVYKKMWANGRRTSAEEIKANSLEMY
ncbi:cytochrome d ubiquinol oxidase subunit II [Allofrancisella guangzhouensis]|uniref:Cytochrome C oxidase assembly protein n=1 Tax=Allofrancisella guangzhouensis TaxID=594679 RepID=A0A0A8E3I8_9GAMM|nr:cytochrome d ubiquinol oxidase subunit II [Allofrancisella guangzhouensis]AJC48548.1 cytochrome C oxidase assembly protein [Allofrancisella guangzhouensis]MBK2027787.1 cytochrome d ubiquinol oxidase subunit II [Allofrancisella guangzhouensis]MBK2043525.1 cytochrome d ubiquinol oxidase subunit II [Allofrancisella guangzhouensis]MBK2045772.1 cytochrome d ubiquinol oxidase subunit II [Allofrancisella guangzhouensis]